MGIEELRQYAANILRDGRVKLLIGYGEGGDGRVVPMFITATEIERCSQLIYDQRCTYNLSVYLLKAEIKSLWSGAVNLSGKVALVAKVETVRSALGLIAENQIKKEDLCLLGVRGVGAVAAAGAVGTEGDWSSISSYCERVFDVGEDVGGDIGEKNSHRLPEKLDQEIDALLKKSPEERLHFWRQHFASCIRCYACRQICPHCFCSTCIVEKSMPQWVSPVSSESGNFSWNIIRAYHLVGRCVGCGECARACPMGLRLDLLNRYMVKMVQEKYSFKAGLSAEDKPPLTTYHLNDNQDFIK
ncbi:MAG: 4Fe-4S binding protein [Oligoflexia bacterium]|nr:4Fe-4S binding protein [Oligoflexia bacterium]